MYPRQKLPVCISQVGLSSVATTGMNTLSDCLRVRLTSPDGQAESDASVRYFSEGWSDAGSTDAFGAAYVDPVATAVEVVWEGSRAVYPLTDDGVDVVLGRVDDGTLSAALKARRPA